MDAPAQAASAAQTTQATPAPAAPTRGGQDVLTVSEVNRRIAGLLERNFPLGWVRGEISNFTRAASGHWYFSLKDAGAQIRCVMFKGRNQYADFTPREGEAVEVRALVTMYEARGELQLSVEGIRRAGLGNLYEAFLRLKAALEAQGLFDPERKRPLPRHPRAIGVVTSLQAAALRDVLTTLRRRAPHVPVIVYPVPVQGAGASDRIAAMLDTVNARAEVDVVILCRGGGSIEDLWAFNEEPVARAVAASEIPIVAGVGHETDVTIVDFVADVRAPTPTGAAELVSPDRARMLRDVGRDWDALSAQFRRQLDRRAQTVDWLARRLRSPQAQMRERRTQLSHLEGRLRFALTGRVQRAEHVQRLLTMRLTAARMSPASALCCNRPKPRWHAPCVTRWRGRRSAWRGSTPAWSCWHRSAPWSAATRCCSTRRVTPSAIRTRCMPGRASRRGWRRARSTSRSPRCSPSSICDWRMN